MSTRFLSYLLIGAIAFGAVALVLERSTTNREGCENGCSAYERFLLEGFRGVFLGSFVIAGVLLARVIRGRRRPVEE